MDAHLWPETEHSFQGCIFTISQSWPTLSTLTHDVSQWQLTYAPYPFYERRSQLFHPINLVESYTWSKSYTLPDNTNNMFGCQRKF